MLMKIQVAILKAWRLPRSAHPVMATDVNELADGLGCGCSPHPQSPIPDSAQGEAMNRYPARVRGSRGRRTLALPCAPGAVCLSS